MILRIRVPDAFVLAINIALLSGCGVLQGGNDVPDFATRDSSGVQIVETNRVNWPRNSRPSIDTLPYVQIGDSTAANPQYTFTQFSGAVRSEDGSIIIADSGGTRLRFYDSAGVFIRDVSVPSSGSSAADGIFRTEKCGKGTLLVRPLARAPMWWTTRGERIGPAKFALPKAGLAAVTVAGLSTPLYHACSPDGRIIMTGWGDRARQPSFETMPEGTAVRYQAWSKLWVVDTSGKMLLEMRDTIIAERIQTKSADGSSQGSGEHFFGRKISMAMDSARIYISHGDKLEVSVYNREGGLQAIWRAPREDLRITAAMLRNYMQARLTGSDSVTRVRYAPYDVDLPLTYPAFDDLHLTQSGHLWARRFHMPWETRVRFGLFAPDGRFMGYASVPRALEVTEMGDDFLLAVRPGERTFVQLHRVGVGR